MYYFLHDHVVCLPCGRVMMIEIIINYLIELCIGFRLTAYISIVCSDTRHVIALAHGMQYFLAIVVCYVNTPLLSQ